MIAEHYINANTVSCDDFQELLFREVTSKSVVQIVMLRRTISSVLGWSGLPKGLPHMVKPFGSPEAGISVPNGLTHKVKPFGSPEAGKCQALTELVGVEM